MRTIKVLPIGAICLLLTACGATGPNLSTNPEAWAFQFSSNVPFTPWPTNDGLWYFDFPTVPGSVHYLTTRYTPAAQPEAISMTFRVETQGNVAFNGNLSADNNCIRPATVRLYFQKANDDYSTDGNRWWSNPQAFELSASNSSDVTLSVPLTPEKWSTVFGEFGNEDEQTQAWFSSALHNMAHVGMTFGGGCFFGHGVQVSGGSARFVLLRFAVE